MTKMAVQSSYKLNLPPYLIVPSSIIKVVETIGQGIHISSITLTFMLYHNIASYYQCNIDSFIKVNSVLFTKDT